jgi:hypothetical protein
MVIVPIKYNCIAVDVNTLCTRLFLASEYGFSPAEIEETPHVSLHVTYYKDAVAVDCGMDARDKYLSIRILKLSSGKKPEHWRLNEQGELVAEYLRELLRKRVAKPLPDIPMSKDISKNQMEFRQTVGRDAWLLKEYGKDILSGSADIICNYRDPANWSRS